MFVDYLTTLLTGVYKVPGPIDATKSFRDLEVDSLSLAELAAQLEDEFSITVEEEELGPQTTVIELSEFLETRGAVLSA
ncbi:acyl carrier protein [Streptomyces sp. SID9727]|uniref:acyl carrier protein n=1 Tax=Streptomyces sp. SID9727 TaxID=2706114 RepID=UPI0013C586F1|nr:acyl carrier protein [Streptomyces sp. SID9727]NEC66329.1 acyl carrier protein [Streptomyces sp. SID9727]